MQWSVTKPRIRSRWHRNNHTLRTINRHDDDDENSSTARLCSDIACCKQLLRDCVFDRPPACRDGRDFAAKNSKIRQLGSTSVGYARQLSLGSTVANPVIPANIAAYNCLINIDRRKQSRPSVVDSDKLHAAITGVRIFIYTFTACTDVHEDLFSSSITEPPFNNDRTTHDWTSL